MKRGAALLFLVSCSTALTPDEEYRAAIETKDNARALELLNHAIARSPRADYYVVRAMVHQTLKQPAAAVEDYGAAIALEKDNPTLRLNRGIAEGELKRYADAEADFAEAIRLLPEFTEAYLQRSRFRREQGRVEEAAKDAQDARRIGAELADGFYNEGVRALKHGENGVAERMFRFALDLNPDFGHAHVAMARLHMEARRFAEAARELDLGIKVHPKDAELYYHRGTALLAAGRGEEALADYDKAVDLDGAQAPYLAARGLAYNRVRHDVENSRKDLDQAIRFDGECYSAWFNRGLLMHELKDLDAAERDLRKALSLRASPEGTLALGRVLHDRGDYDRALDLYRRSLEFYRDPEAQKELREESERTRRAKEEHK